MGKSGSIGWALAFELAPAAILGARSGLRLRLVSDNLCLASRRLRPQRRLLAPPGLALASSLRPSRTFSICRLRRGRKSSIEQPSALVGGFWNRRRSRYRRATPRFVGSRNRRKSWFSTTSSTAVELDFLRVVRLFEPTDTAGRAAFAHRRSPALVTAADAPGCHEELHDALAALRLFAPLSHSSISSEPRC